MRQAVPQRGEHAAAHEHARAGAAEALHVLRGGARVRARRAAGAPRAQDAPRGVPRATAARAQRAREFCFVFFFKKKAKAKSTK